MNKHVILLGAGAVIPMGAPSTKILTEKIKNIKGMSDITDMLDNYYNADSNFETYIAAIESLLSYSISNQTIGKTPSNSNILPALYNYKRDDLNDVEWAWMIYSDCINSVISEIKGYAHTDISKNWDDYFTYLNKELSQGGHLKIYSLNYDRVIPLLWKNRKFKIYEGTDEQGNFEFDLKRFEESKCTYFNLHGSIHLKSDNSISDFTQSTYIAKLIKGGNPGENILFSPIITGYSKTQRILSEPFNFGVSAFYADINSASDITIIGYSFGDAHINAIIRQKLFINNRVKITIVDFASADNPIESIKLRIENTFLLSLNWTETQPNQFTTQDNKFTLFAIGVECFLSNI